MVFTRGRFYFFREGGIWEGRKCILGPSGKGGGGVSHFLTGGNEIFEFENL